MLARILQLLVFAALLLLSASPALAAYAYDQGQTVALGFNNLSTAYEAYWFSDKDGYLMRGNPLRTSKLSAGNHVITWLLYRTSTGALAQRGTVDVEIKAPTTTPSSGSSSGTPTTVAPGEFEPITELLLGTPDAYMVDDVYPQMIDAIRGEATKTRIYVDNRYVEYDLEDIFVQWGVDDADYTYVTTPVDSIWMRDYGPLFTKNNGRLEVVDLQYYPERPYDDAIPATVAREKGISNRKLAVYWEGGNFTSDGRGNLFTSDGIYARNSLSAATVDSRVGAALYGRVNALEYMLNDGGTRHLDMFVFMTGARSVFVNRFPSGHQNAARMDRNAEKLRSLGFTVTRIDLANTAYSSYSNGLIVNKTVIVPTYGKTSTDNAAIAAYRAAGYRPVGIDCRRIIQWAGAIHCITITVPK